ncbi:MAG: DUF2934 domain-containing protein [Sideroxydans sp.]|nr:DUF2934 domain-containing protein [Sideroxydans sp.]
MSRMSSESSKRNTPKNAMSSEAPGGKKSQPVHSTKTLGDGMDRYQMIATAAYFRAEQRGFKNGNPVDDWIAAEAEIDQLYH